MKRLTLALSSLLALGACDKTREQFDFSKQAPDEFAIIKRAPLEMPTEYTSLPKPQPGAPRPQEQSPTSQARATLLGDRALPPVATGASQGEAALLQQASAESAASSSGGGALWKALVASVCRLKRKFTGSISRACAAARARAEAGINVGGTWDMRDTPWAAQA